MLVVYGCLRYIDRVGGSLKGHILLLDAEKKTPAQIGKRLGKKLWKRLRVLFRTDFFSAEV